MLIYICAYKAPLHNKCAMLVYMTHVFRLDCVASWTPQGSRLKKDPNPSRFDNVDEFLAKKQDSNKLAGKFMFVPYEITCCILHMGFRVAYVNSGMFGFIFLFIFCSVCKSFFFFFFCVFGFFFRFVMFMKYVVRHAFTGLFR